MSPRLPYLDPNGATEETRKLLSALPALNVFKLVAQAETAFEPLAALGKAILTQLDLPASTREIAILHVARLSSCRYEWLQHVPIAKGCGVTETEIAALARGDINAKSLSDRDRAMLRLSDEVVRNVRPSDETLTNALRYFAAREIVELVLSIGFYMTLARVIETADIELDDAAGMSAIDAFDRL
jgi:4-carboxymuconolactone decarboxylase